MLIVTYIFLALIASLLTIFPPRNRTAACIALVLIGMIMIIPSWRIDGVDRGVYLLGYDDWRCVAEASYHHVSDFVDAWLGDVRFVFLFYAVLAVGIKLSCLMCFIPRMVCFGSVLVYLSHFYMLHEMVQIRCGLAAAFFIAALCLKMRRAGNHRMAMIPSLALIAIASYFHYSAVMGFLAILLPVRGFRLSFWALLLGVAIVLNVFGVTASSVLGMLQVEIFLAMLEKYLISMEQGLNVVFNPLGVTMLVRYALYGLMLCVVSKSRHVYWPITYLMKVYGIGLLLTLLFSDMPALAVRAGQFLFVAEIMLVPLLAYRQLRERAWLPILMFCGVNAALNVFLINLFAPGE